MGQTFWDVEQVSRDENPIGVKFPHGFDDMIVPWLISVQVQIRELDCTTTGKGRMWVSEDGHLMIGQTPFPMRNKAERPIEWLA